MDLLQFDEPFDDDLTDPVIVVALDGWTDAGSGGTMAASTLREQWEGRRIGTFDPDRLFDYRDRRPLMTIDRGLLGTPQWPSLEMFALTPPAGPSVVLLTGAEPDFAWQALCADVSAFAVQVGAARYVGLGSVPGPVPHTRPTRIITTAGDEETLATVTRPHERVMVPASAQVVLESALRDAGLRTMGLWARVPHYVAGEYPEGTRALLAHFASHTGTTVETDGLREEIEANRTRLDQAASSSPEISAHITELEEAYDSDLADEGGMTGPLPTGDQIAAELERFLRNQAE